MKSFLLIYLLCFLTFSGYAQKRSDPPAFTVTEVLSVSQSAEDREAFKRKIQAHKIAYFTDELSLTPEEAEKFWPLYNTFFNKRETLMHEFTGKTRCKPKSTEKPKFDVSQLSDAEVQELLNNKMKIIELEKEFHQNLCELFAPKRVLKFYHAEREFHRELISIQTNTQHSGNRKDKKVAVKIRTGKDALVYGDTIFKIVDNCDNLHISTNYPVKEQIINEKPIFDRHDPDTIFLDIRTSDGQLLRVFKKDCDSNLQKK